MLARAALRAKTRDDLDDEVDLVRQQRVQVDEAVARQLGQLDVGGEPGVLGEAAAMFVEELAERRLGGRVLREHASAGDFGDVGRLEMDLQREAVHEPASSILLSSRPLTSSPSFSCEVTTIQCLPRPFTPRLCTMACRSSIFCTSRATNWPTSSTTNIRALAGLAALHQFVGALGQLAGRDVRLVLGGLHPGVRHRVGRRVELCMHARSPR